MKNLIYSVVCLCFVTCRVIEGGFYEASTRGARYKNIERLMETSECNGGEDDWEPIGDPIDGLNKDDLHGSIALSTEGNKIAIGAPSWKAGKAKGLARVFQFGSAWTQVGEDIKGDSKFEKLGQSVALSADGNILAVGTPSESDQKDFAGKVQVYQYDSNNQEWNTYGNAIENDKKEEYFGFSLALSSDGNSLLIGMATSQGGPKGSISLYRYNSNDEDYEVIVDKYKGEGKTDMFGYFVEMTPDAKVIATIAIATGQVYVYDVTDSDELEARGDISFNSDQGHIALSDDGQYIAMSAPYESSEKGEIQVLEYKSGSDSWIQIGQTIVGLNESSEEGLYIDLVVSENGFYLVSSIAGDKIVRTYKYDGTNWIQYGTDISANTADDKGSYVAFSQDGQILAVGSPNIDDNTGQVIIYQWCQIASESPSESPSLSPSESPSTIPSLAPSLNPSNAPSVYECKDPWDPLGKDIVGTSDSDNIGPVAISWDGTIIAIGSEQNGDNNVYKYNEAPRKWEQLGTSSISSGAEAVAISTEKYEYTLALGYPSVDTRGKIEILTFNSVDWILETNPIGGDQYFAGTKDNQKFGSSLAFSKDGMSLVVGAPSTDGEDGSFFVYTHVYGFGWLKATEIKGAVEGFGTSVAISNNGKYIAVGSPLGGDDEEGEVYVYTYGNNGLEQFGDTLLGSKGDEEFGSSVALEGIGEQLILAIGAPKGKKNGNKKSGYVSVFEWSDDEDKWIDYGDGDIAGSNEKAFAGASIALAEDGSTIAVGEVGAEKVFVYTLNGDTEWEKEGQTIKNEGVPQYLSMSADGDAFAIGSPEFDDNFGKVTVMGWCEDAGSINRPNPLD